MRQKLVVLTGAGMSAESGLKTFRDMGGLWEEYEIYDVASFLAWQKNKELVLRFYNARRSQLSRVKPNAGHYALAELEQYYDVHLITQNVDDLHELAGSKNILHLHGELTKARSTQDDSLIYDIGYKAIEVGDVCELGSQLRPHIVWFGEAVPESGSAANLVESADILVVNYENILVYTSMKKKFRSIKYKKPVIRDTCLSDRGWRRSFFEFSSVFKRAKLRLQLPNFNVWFKQASDEELKITPRVWFLRSGVGVLSHPNPSRKQLVVVSTTALVNLIYGKKPKAREWNQIKKLGLDNQSLL